jgi:hypothetical protein
MKFRFCNFFLRLGPAPIAANNFFSIQHHGPSSLVRVAAFAEQFDAALSFYMEVSVAMRGATDSCWFELQRRTRKRLPSEVVKGIGMVGYTQHGALYGDIGSEGIRELINEFWLSDRFRMVGTSRIPPATAVELAKALDNKGLDDRDAGAHALPTSVLFVLEKQHVTGEPFLALLVDNRLVNSTRELISRAAARLQRPLLEVGPEAWPPENSR